MALLVPPDFLLLDEISNGVDPLTRQSLYTYLKSLKSTTTFLITHRIDEAEKICDNLGILVEGQLRDVGTPSALKQRHGELFLLQIDVCEHEDEGDSIAAVEQIIKERLPFCHKVKNGHESVATMDYTQDLHT